VLTLEEFTFQPGVPFMSKIRTLFGRFAAEESGATMVEYAVMVALIAVVAVAAVRIVGTKTSAAFTAAGAALP